MAGFGRSLRDSTKIQLRMTTHLTALIPGHLGFILRNARHPMRRKIYLVVLTIQFHRLQICRDAIGFMSDIQDPADRNSSFDALLRPEEGDAR